jgi:hypothetical protein
MIRQRIKAVRPVGVLAQYNDAQRVGQLTELRVKCRSYVSVEPALPPV